MKLTDVWSYQNLLDLINKVAMEYSNPFWAVEGLLRFDPLGNPEIEYNIIRYKKIRGKYKLARTKRLRECWPEVLKWSVDDCLYRLRYMVDKRLRLESL